MRRNHIVFVLMAVLVVLLLACGKSPSNQQAEPPATTTPGRAAAPAATGGAGTRAAAPAANPGATTAAIPTIPAGDHIMIRLGETLSSKRNNSGDAFSGTVAEPVTVNGQVVIPQGATATGTVADAKPLGKIKGGAVLRIVLNSVNVNGKNYNIETEAVTRSLQGKGKRSAVAIGGGGRCGRGHHRRHRGRRQGRRHRRGGRCGRRYGGRGLHR